VDGRDDIVCVAAVDNNNICVVFEDDNPIIIHSQIIHMKKTKMRIFAWVVDPTAAGAVFNMTGWLNGCIIGWFRG